MDYVDKNKFLKEYGFKPENMLLYLALLGDASDNIPGVK
jgi:5'-3' exonuclease